MLLRLRGAAGTAVINRGLCAPAAANSTVTETWKVIRPEGIPPGGYTVEALFIDNTRRAWFESTGGGDLGKTFLSPPIVLGRIKVE